MATVKTVVSVDVESVDGESTTLNLSYAGATELRDALIQAVGRPRIPRGPRVGTSEKPAKSGKRRSNIISGVAD